MIYFIQAEGVGHIKIGHAAVDAEARLTQMQTGCPLKLNLLCVIRGRPSEEKLIHRRFAHLRVRGEWFRPDPELLAFIESHKGSPVQRDHLADFWHQANCVASAPQRDAFNLWRETLYTTIDELRDLLRRLSLLMPDEDDRRWGPVLESVNRAVDGVCEAPLLMR